MDILNVGNEKIKIEEGLIAKEGRDGIYNIQPDLSDKKVLSGKISRGYQLQVESWENGGDFYNTIVLSGLTKEEAKYNKELAHLVGSAPYCNIEVLENNDKVELLKRFEELATKYNDVESIEYVSEIREECNLENFDFQDYDSIIDCVGNKAWNVLGVSDGCVFRACSSVKVYYCPLDVHEVYIG